MIRNNFTSQRMNIFIRCDLHCVLFDNCIFGKVFLFFRNDTGKLGYHPMWCSFRIRYIRWTKWTLFHEIFAFKLSAISAVDSTTSLVRNIFIHHVPGKVYPRVTRGKLCWIIIRVLKLLGFNFKSECVCKHFSHFTHSLMIYRQQNFKAS